MQPPTSFLQHRGLLFCVSGFTCVEARIATKGGNLSETRVYLGAEESGILAKSGKHEGIIYLLVF